MKYFKKTSVYLAVIFLTAALLRVPLLGELPPGLTIDEAGQGYSAYSILKTGRDEWGDFLPLNPRGFGDYKPPLFMYMIVPSVAVFGLNGFALRLPSAIAGVLTVLAVFFLARDLFRSRNLGLVSSLLLAISPWHIYYSRLGWESNIGLLFFALGIWLFVKGLQKRVWLSFSALSFGLSTLSYHSFKFLVPIMVSGLVIIYWRELRRLSKKNLLSVGIISFIFILILSFGFIFSGAGRRAADQSILKEESLGQLRNDQFSDKLPQPLPRLLNNKYEFIFSRVVDNYIGYYSLSFLFGPHRSESSVLNFPTQGLLYIWQLPLLLFGIFYLIRLRNKASLVIFLWLFAAPTPASLTQDYAHAGRAQAIFPVLTIITALGLVYFFAFIRSRKHKLIALLFAVTVVSISLALRIDNYLYHTFNRQHGGLVPAYLEIIKYTQENIDKYNKIIFTKSHSEPQAFIAFYTKWDPQDFQMHSQAWKSFEDKFRFMDMADTYSLGKYEFKKVDLSRDMHEKNALIIGTPDEISPLIKPKYFVNDLIGKTAFIAVESDEIPR